MVPSKIYGLIGYPVKHSLSPLMHNAAFKYLGIDAEYRLFEIKPEELECVLLKNIVIKDVNGASISAKDISGFNVTIPHKIRAREILEREFPYDKDAYSMSENLYYVRLTGAVNTVRRKAGGLEYFNTDAPGFIKSLDLDLGFKTKGKNVFVIGIGGAGRAVIAALTWKDRQVNKIFINDINEESVDSAKEHFFQFRHIGDMIEFVSLERIPRVIKACHLIVNTSPVGMKDRDKSVIDKSFLHKDLSVYDVVYNRRTLLIRESESLGLSAVGGIGMLLYQGVECFEYWTEQKAPVEIMKETLTNAVRRS